MTKRILSLALSLLLLVPPASAAPAVVHTSIAPLSVLGEGVICTVWSLNEAKGYWATAAHCVSRPNVYFIQSEPAQVIEREEVDDYAILKTKTGAKALPIADNQPSVGDNVFTMGYPLGNKRPVFSFGKIMALVAEVPIYESDFTPPTRNEYTLFTMPVAPGHSGSPIFSHGAVVSLLQIGGGGFAGGLEWRKLVTHIRKYREGKEKGA